MDDRDKRLGQQAHAQHGNRQNRQNHKFARVDVFHFFHGGMEDVAENHALIHPQRVARAPNQRGRRNRAYPQAVMRCAHNHHKFAHKTRCGGQACVCHAKQHHKRGKFGHHIHHTAVIGNIARVQTVVHHADTHKHRSGNKAVRNHLHNRAFKRPAFRLPILHKQEKAQRNKPHMAN